MSRFGNKADRISHAARGFGIMNSRNQAVFSNARATGFVRINRASWIDTLRVVAAVMVPTAAKGVIIRRPIMERLAQRQDLDTGAVRQMQRLVKKYGRAPLLLPIPFRPQLLVLDPADVSTVLECSPQPFATATGRNAPLLRISNRKTC
ncbi:hypothetical protein [Rhizobium laguerreae]|uniref:hypothetical protein n=1 Tax=Rhizobium laguerreae TaxID=1076926 RepID=UPI001FED81CC|nr:hypothetical protein [Rhizobium laguerreae]